MDWKIFKADGGFWAEHAAGKVVRLASFTDVIRLGYDFVTMRLADEKAFYAARQAEPRKAQ